MGLVKLFFVFLLSSCAALDTFTFTLRLKEIPGKPPTFEQAQKRREQTTFYEAGPAGWTNQAVTQPNSSPAPANILRGAVIDSTKYPNILRIRRGKTFCVATLVGPRVLLTSAHCGDNGETIEVHLPGGAKTSGRFFRYSLYPEEDVDLAVVNLPRDLALSPMSIETRLFEYEGREIEIVGPGCKTPRGGTDGLLRTGKTSIVSSQGNDIYSSPALCFGEMGAPVIYQGKVVGLYSKGFLCKDSRCENATTRTTAFGINHLRGGQNPVKAFLLSFVERNELRICGINASCDRGNIIPVRPEPTSFVATSEDGTLSLIVKKTFNGKVRFEMQ